MNTFISTKLGEVLAFAKIGKDTAQKGKKGFLKLVNADSLKKMDSTFITLEQKILKIAEKEKVVAEVKKDAKESFDKIIAMRNTYIAGAWSDQSEILEWMGFYTGAALVHWHLLAGAGKAMKLIELEKLSKQALTFYSKLFVSDERTLQKLGATSVRK